MKIATIIVLSIMTVIVILGIFFPWIVMLPFFIFGFHPQDTEMVRVSSPDGKFDAVYIESSAGAMDSGSYLVYIVPKAQKPTGKDKAVFLGRHEVYDLAVSWEGNRKLLIQYSKADIKHFQNYFYPYPKETKDRIEIRECQISKKE